MGSVDIEKILKNKATFDATRLSDLEYAEIFNALDQHDRDMIRYADGEGPRILCRSDGWQHSERCYCEGHLIYNTMSTSDWGRVHREIMERARIAQASKGTSMTTTMEEFEKLVKNSRTTWVDVKKATDGLTLTLTDSGGEFNLRQFTKEVTTWHNDLWYSGGEPGPPIKRLWAMLRRTNEFKARLHSGTVGIRIRYVGDQIELTSINGIGEGRTEWFSDAFQSAYKADWNLKQLSFYEEFERYLKLTAPALPDVARLCNAAYEQSPIEVSVSEDVGKITPTFLIQLERNTTAWHAIAHDIAIDRPLNGDHFTDALVAICRMHENPEMESRIRSISLDCKKDVILFRGYGHEASFNIRQAYSSGVHSTVRLWPQKDSANKPKDFWEALARFQEPGRELPDKTKELCEAALIRPIIIDFVMGGEDLKTLEKFYLSGSWDSLISHNRIGDPVDGDRITDVVAALIALNKRELGITRAVMDFKSDKVTLVGEHGELSLTPKELYAQKTRLAMPTKEPELKSFEEAVRWFIKIDSPTHGICTTLCNWASCGSIQVVFDPADKDYTKYAFSNVLQDLMNSGGYSTLCAYSNSALNVDGTKLTDFVSGAERIFKNRMPNIKPKIRSVNFYNGKVDVHSYGTRWLQFTPAEFYRFSVGDPNYISFIRDWPEQILIESTPKTIEPEAPKMATEQKTEQKIARTLETISNDGKAMALRAGAKQAVKLVQTPLVTALAAKMAPGDEAMRQKIALFLATDVGEAVIGLMLSLATQVGAGKIAKDPSHVKLLGDLSRELYLESGAKAMDFVADIAMGPVREGMGVMIGMLDSGVAMTALPEMPNIENLTAGSSEKIETVEEVVAERVK